MKELVQKTKSFLFRRQQAYQQVFNDSEFSKRVLRDLARFCRAHDTAFHADARLHAVLEGRREVWLRIQQHLNMDSETLWQTYGRKDLE